MEAITDPSTPAFFREVEAPSASPPPVLVPGNGRLSLLRLHRFWLRRSGLGGICGVAFVARVVVRSDDALRDMFDGLEPFDRTAGMRRDEVKPTRAPGFG
ncbi:hypothetical protein HID58_018641 [Brassica napus]|uniref:Uncharacterized protein n=1 Tax=Brassica napus TaxID=3708 RepID=A0ABQ8DAK6_BRANA|nr:hypothetical protein HID58_018641 [Brassica napus]